MPTLKITLLALALGFSGWAGCGSNPVDGDVDSEPDILQDDTHKGLQFFRERWAARGPATYAISLFERCVCVQNLILYRVAVEDGTPIAATRSGSTFPEEPVPVEDVPYPTVEALFDLIQSGFDANADSVGVQYSTDLGRPDRLTIDFIPNVADEEINVFVDSFEPPD